MEARHLTAGLGNAQLIAVTGLNAQTFGIQIIGNNLANVDTVAFKSNRAEFANLMYQNFQLPRATTNTDPGNNPIQFGIGVQFGSTTFDLKQGPITPTGIQEDFAIDGGGYFIVQNGDAQFYTRNGNFTLDSQGQLVTSQGYPILGYGVDTDFNIDTSKLQSLKIPIGSAAFGLPTKNLNWSGQLNMNGTYATQATIRKTEATNATSLASPIGGLQVGGISLVNDGSGGFTSPVEITYTPMKASATLAPETITLNPSDPLSKLTDFITNALQINTSVPQPAGNTAGAILGTNGEIQLTGNLGTANDFTIKPADFVVKKVGSTQEGHLNLDLDNQLQAANGESTATKTSIFDSRGLPVTLNSTIYLDGVNSEGSTWKVLYASPDNSNGTDSSQILGSSILHFDNNGRIASDSNPDVTIQLSNRTGTDPLTFENNYDSVFSMGFPSTQLGATNQDGLARGELVDYTVLQDGTIKGKFSNGGSRPIGQFLLAKFPNPEGLIAGPNSLFMQSLTSGEPVISLPQSGAGMIRSESLEGSNVDVATQLTQLLQYSLGFGANGRTFATAQEMVTSFTQTIRQV